MLNVLNFDVGKWEESAEMRKKMKERNLVKEGGCSWIEVGDKFHKFYVGDTSHPNTHRIYDELDRLIREIKRCGYVPDTDLVLHKLEEEDDVAEKERLLFQHSEKIAVAFGLISTSKSRPVRVFKNLRVCGDCHNAMKYITVVSGREIVLRDLNRFHHFKDGKCSCNDYW